MLHNWYQFIQKVISFQGRFEDIHDYYVLLQETDAKKDSKLHLLKKIHTAPPQYQTMQQQSSYYTTSSNVVKNRTLKFLCFNAGVCFNQIQKLTPRSIILTSGTLAPLQSF